VRPFGSCISFKKKLSFDFVDFNWVSRTESESITQSLDFWRSTLCFNLSYQIREMEQDKIIKCLKSQKSLKKAYLDFGRGLQNESEFERKLFLVSRIYFFRNVNLFHIYYSRTICFVFTLTYYKPTLKKV